MALVGVVEVDQEQLALSLVRKATLWQVLLVAVGVSKSCVRHEQKVGRSHEIEGGHGLVLQIVVEIVSFVDVQIVNRDFICSLRKLIVRHHLLFAAQQRPEEWISYEVNALLPEV